MRALRNFKLNRCYHLIGRIAHRAFFLTEEERYSPFKRYKLSRRGKAVVHA